MSQEHAKNFRHEIFFGCPPQEALASDPYGKLTKRAWEEVGQKHAAPYHPLDMCISKIIGHEDSLPDHFSMERNGDYCVIGIEA